MVVHIQNTSGSSNTGVGIPPCYTTRRYSKGPTPGVEHIRYTNNNGWENTAIGYLQLEKSNPGSNNTLSSNTAVFVLTTTSSNYSTATGSGRYNNRQ
jgi:hypothetical protein